MLTAHIRCLTVLLSALLLLRTGAQLKQVDGVNVWMAWSPCSATCGQGISTRQCQTVSSPDEDGNVLRTQGATCNGTSTQVKLCNLEPCPSDQPSNHQTYCSLYNSRTFSGRQYVWEPFIHPNSCKLACRAKGEHFYANLPEKAENGTPCKVNMGSAVCVNGVCKQVGCDGIVESAAVRDVCGVCKGDSSSCQTISGIFTSTDLKPGVNYVISIPGGSTNINITELRASKNYLIVQTVDGRFIINNETSSSYSSVVEAAGTVFKHEAKVSPYRKESITAPGPTNITLVLKILLKGSNPGILYSFSVPRDVGNAVIQQIRHRSRPIEIPPESDRDRNVPDSSSPDRNSSLMISHAAKHSPVTQLMTRPAQYSLDKTERHRKSDSNTVFKKSSLTSDGKTSEQNIYESARTTPKMSTVRITPGTFSSYVVNVNSQDIERNKEDLSVVRNNTKSDVATMTNSENILQNQRQTFTFDNIINRTNLLSVGVGDNVDNLHVNKSNNFKDKSSYHGEDSWLHFLINKEDRHNRNKESTDGIREVNSINNNATTPSNFSQQIVDNALKDNQVTSFTNSSNPSVDAISDISIQSETVPLSSFADPNANGNWKTNDNNDDNVNTRNTSQTTTFNISQNIFSLNGREIEDTTHVSRIGNEATTYDNKLNSPVSAREVNLSKHKHHGVFPADKYNSPMANNVNEDDTTIKVIRAQSQPFSATDNSRYVVPRYSQSFKFPHRYTDHVSGRSRPTLTHHRHHHSQNTHSFNVSSKTFSENVDHQNMQPRKGSSSNVGHEDVKSFKGSSSNVGHEDVQSIKGSSSNVGHEDVQSIKGSSSNVGHENMQSIKGSSSNVGHENMQSIKGSSSNVGHEDVQSRRSSSRNVGHEDMQSRNSFSSNVGQVNIISSQSTVLVASYSDITSLSSTASYIDTVQNNLAETYQRFENVNKDIPPHIRNAAIEQRKRRLEEQRSRYNERMKEIQERLRQKQVERTDLRGLGLKHGDTNANSDTNSLGINLQRNTELLNTLPLQTSQTANETSSSLSLDTDSSVTHSKTYSPYSENVDSDQVKYEHNASSDLSLSHSSFVTSQSEASPHIRDFVVPEVGYPSTTNNQKDTTLRRQLVQNEHTIFNNRKNNNADSIADVNVHGRNHETSSLHSEARVVLQPGGEIPNTLTEYTKQYDSSQDSIESGQSGQENVIDSPSHETETLPLIRNTFPYIPSMSQNSSKRLALDRFVGSNQVEDENISRHTSLNTHSLVYEWRVSGLTQCTHSCGGGIQQTVVVCVDTVTQAVVTDENCRHFIRPKLLAVPCNTRPCAAEWVPGHWSSCTVSCGTGEQTRIVSCQARVSPTLNMTMPGSSCEGQDRIPDRQTCSNGRCSSWQVGAWSNCSTSCGDGHKSRSISCIDLNGHILSDHSCTEIKPHSQEPCNLGECGQGWFFAEWNQQCSSECGAGIVKRQVFCADKFGANLPDNRCDINQQPPATQSCSARKLCGASWYAGLWSQCDVKCGPGSRRRHVVCVQELSASVFAVVGKNNCTDVNKPAEIEPCQLPPCASEWYMTSWSQCSKTCGTGSRTREVRCLDPDQKDADDCLLQTRPKTRDSCNTHSCSNAIIEGKVQDCTDKFSQCSMVKRARLCRYNYYRKMCCKSCAEHIFPTIASDIPGN